MNTTTPDALVIKMLLNAWHNENKRITDLIDTLTDEQLAAETAPGRNTGMYLLGHLAAVNDNLFKLLTSSERLHPELDVVFLHSKDKSGKPMPSATELKAYWNEINTGLSAIFWAMQPSDWMEPHNAISAEAFAKEPHRNKLNVIISRTIHQSYHLGQMNYLKK